MDILSKMLVMEQEVWYIIVHDEQSLGVKKDEIATDSQ